MKGIGNRSCRIICYLIINFLVNITYGQEMIKGTVRDGGSEEPLYNAYVRMGNRNTKTDASGNFSLALDAEEELEVGLHGFHEFRIRPADLISLDDITVYLTPKPDLEGLGISDEVQPVYSPDFERVFDYSFIDNQLIIATYFDKKINTSKRNPGYHNCVLSLFENGVSLHRLIIPDFPYRLRESPFGELFLEGSDYALRIRSEKGKLHSTEIKYDDYLSQILPLTAAFDSVVFWVYIIPELPQVVHYAFSVELNREYVVRVVRNHNYFDRVEKDYSMLSRDQLAEAFELSSERGFSDRLFAPYLRRRLVVVDDTPPYSPGFRIGNDYLIFDALNEWIFRHDSNGEVKDSVYAQVNLDGEVLKEILQDPVTEEFFVTHEKSGVTYLRPLNPLQGRLGAAFKISYPFPEKLKIYNGTVYYIRRDVDRGVRHIYSENPVFLRNR